LTRLTRVELVATKLTGQMMPSLLLLLTGLPIIVTSAGCAGLPATFALEALGISATSVAVGASLAILASARRDRSGAARGEAIGWTVMWLGGLPIITLMPVSSGTLWGDLLVEIRRICSWIAPSSPLSLLTDTSWMTGSSSLSQRLLMMLALQIVVIIFALVGAVIGLRLREPRPTEWDPHRGYRPPVSDDPIFWREYILPWRGSRQPLVVILARQILILVRMILWISLRLLFLTAAVAVPIGSVIGAGWFGYYAFVELWNQGSFTAGKYEARYGLNLFIRGATAFLALVPLLALPGAVSWRMTIERDKKTWEPLLTTPLTGAEILSSKLRVSAVTLLSTARWLIPLWLLGMGCGALHPLGVLVTAVEMPLVAWLGLALGIWLGLRPGSTTQATSSAAALWSLGVMLLGGLVTIVPLCSHREMAEIHSWETSVHWLVGVSLVTTALSMAAFAWYLMRRCFQHFDEWVGRPCRALTGRSLAPSSEPREPTT
jgi:hypothetical protein